MPPVGRAAPKGGDSHAAKTTTSNAYDADEHLLTPLEAASRFGTHVDPSHPDSASRGLTTEQVASLRSKYGRNALTPPKTTPEIVKLLRQFCNPLLLMLALACVLTFFVYGVQRPRERDNLILASVMAVVVVVLAFTSYWQERSAGNVMASLKSMMPAQCTVVRDGAERRVDAAELVPGDLVRLSIGGRVPADARVVRAHDLKVEMSSLTGESDLVPVGEERRSGDALESRCLVFAGSQVMQGRGLALVIRTGDRTVLGRIAALASSSSSSPSSSPSSSTAADKDAKKPCGGGGGCGGGRAKGASSSAAAPPKTTLQVEIDRLVVFVAVVATVVPVTLFAIGAARRRLTPLDAFVNGFVLAVVACVLQGLRATVLSLLALCSTRLRERQVLVKSPDIIENLGCATVICSDKTGTLTQNVMTVQSVWVGGMGARRHAADEVVVAAALSGGGGGGGAGGETAAGGSAALAALTTATEPTTSASAPVSASARCAWSGASPLTKLALIAAVCNSAQYEKNKKGALTSSSGDVAPPPAPPPAPEGAVAISVFAGAAGGEDEKEKEEDAATTTKTPAAPVLLGDATDCGLLRFAERILPTTAAARARYRKVYERPFNSTDKFALVVVEEQEEGGSEEGGGGLGGGGGGGAGAGGGRRRTMIFLKGAPEVVAAKCGAYFMLRAHHPSPSAPPIDPVFEAEMDGAYRSAGGAGERVLGFAFAPLGRDLLLPSPAPSSSSSSSPPDEAALSAAVDRLVAAKALTFMGLISLMDPPREGVKRAVETCRSAGIRVMMLTGDHPLTAEAIARKIGLITRPVVRGTSASVLRPPPQPDAPFWRLAELTRQQQQQQQQQQQRGREGAGDRLGPLPLPDSLAALPPLARLSKNLSKDGADANNNNPPLARLSRTYGDGLPPLARKSPLVFQPARVVAEHGATALVVTGAELRELDSLAAEGKISPAEHEARWNGMLSKLEIVFARTSPEQKLQIVERLSSHFGEVVAVTGDGVNDAPALKRAAIGVAMGKGGSDVARDAADLILLDDDFTSVVGACEEGRVVFDNLRKSIAFATAKVLAEVLPLFMLVALDTPIGMTGLLILSIDLLTDQPPAISLAYEPAESATMQRPPRDRRKERLISAKLLTHSYLVVGAAMSLACLLSYFTAFWSNDVPLWAIWGRGATNWKEGAPPLEICSDAETAACRTLSGAEQHLIVREAHSAWYVTLILCQAVHIFCCKTRVVSIFAHGPFKNRKTVYGLLVSFAVGAVVVFVPGVDDVFGAAPPPGLCWVPFVAFGLWVVAYTEGIKWRARVAPEGWVAWRLVW